MLLCMLLQFISDKKTKLFLFNKCISWNIWISFNKCKNYFLSYSVSTLSFDFPYSRKKMERLFLLSGQAENESNQECSTDIQFSCIS